MAVNRIVPNIEAADPAAAARFYGEVLGLRQVMDLGWIVTFASGSAGPAQVSVLREGGGGAPVAQLSIEVDDLEAVHRRAVAAGFAILHGPIREAWGVRRFLVRDPFGTVVNVLTHADGAPA
jgi:predicted enzyme related to lactoylglutathione lyase